MCYNGPMMRRLTGIGILVLIFLPEIAFAQLRVDTGVTATIPSIFGGIVVLLGTWSTYVALALFLLGAILMVGSGGHDTTLSAGKKIMKASIVGLAIILASWLILSTFVTLIAR